MVHNLVYTAFTVYEWLILIRIVLSWVRPNTYYPVVRFIYRATEPVLEKARGLIPPVGGIDFSPLLVFLVLRWLRSLFVANLIRVGL